MTKEQRRRLQNKYAQALVTEEDLKLTIADWQGELESADPHYESLKREVLKRQLEGLRAQLKEAQAKTDELRQRCRDLDIGEPEPIHPGGAVAAIMEREKKPTKWDTGGTIDSRESAWAAPEVPGSNRRRNP
jgi:hypothetical protein